MGVGELYLEQLEFAIEKMRKTNENWKTMYL